MERSSRLLQHRNPKNWYYFSKSSKLNSDFFFDLCWRAEITLASSISVLNKKIIHQLISHHDFSIMESQNFDFVKKKTCLSVSAVMFCKQFLTSSFRALIDSSVLSALWALIGAIFLSINIQVGLIIYQSISYIWYISYTCTYMTTSRMHRRPFEGRHLVFIYS